MRTLRTQLFTRPCASYPSHLLFFRPTSTTAAVTDRKPIATPTINTVNAPKTSLPAPLSLPEKDSKTSTVTYYFRTGKAYITFFKTGLRNVFANLSATRPLQSRVDAGDGSLAHLVQTRSLTRAEFQHLLRARHDVKRLPVFALIFLIFGELSPLILPFAAGAVPYNCRIPKQLERERRLRAAARESSFHALGAVGGWQGIDQTKLLSLTEVQHVATVLGVAGRVGRLLERLVRWRVDRRIEYLTLDTELLRRGGGVRAIDAGEELVMAAQDRGISTLGKPEEEVRRELESWMKVTEALGGVKPGIWLVRPESWGVFIEGNTKKQ